MLSSQRWSDPGAPLIWRRTWTLKNHLIPLLPPPPPSPLCFHPPLESEEKLKKSLAPIEWGKSVQRPRNILSKVYHPFKKPSWVWLRKLAASRRSWFPDDLGRNPRERLVLTPKPRESKNVREDLKPRQSSLHNNCFFCVKTPETTSFRVISNCFVCEGRLW